MSKLAVRIRIYSVLLAAVLYGMAGWSQGNARDGRVSSPQQTDVSAGVNNLAADDFGGTPADVKSLSSDSRRTEKVAPAQSDQTEARQAVERGEVRPFGWLLKKLKKTVPGDVVKVRLKHHARDLWTYEVTVLNATGRYVQVSLNAATGAVIKSKYR